MDEPTRDYEEQPRSAEHDFYENLAQPLPSLYDAGLEPPEAETDQFLSPWAIIGVIVLGLLVILALLVALGVFSNIPA